MTEFSSLLIEPHYWGSISYFSSILKADEIDWDIHSNFQKGTYRNRCKIMGPNGLLSLSIPLQKGKNQHTVFKDVKISYAESWRKDHWQSLMTSYRRSAYFEYFEDELAPIYEREFTFLKDLNAATFEVVQKILNLNLKVKNTENYIPKGSYSGIDARDWIHPNPNKMYASIAIQPYQQVFMDRMEFLPDLSILDVLFNVGPKAMEYVSA